jgi:hypothetical protein
MVEIVRYPRGKQLTQGDQTELWVATPPLEILGSESQRLQSNDVVGAEPGEGVKELMQRLALRIGELRKAVERGKRHRLSLSQENFDPRHPVGALPMDEVANDIVWAPGIGSFVGGRPGVGEISEPGSKHGRSTPKEGPGILEGKVHSVRYQQSGTGRA